MTAESDPGIRPAGQARVGVKDESIGAGFGSMLQIAQVSRPLYSVSKMCDSGASVTFTRNDAIVKDKNSKVVAKFKREGGLYVAELEFTDEGTASGFTRQGRHE